MEEEHIEMSEEMALRCLSRRKPMNTLVERGGLPISLKNLGLPQGATYQKDDGHHEITMPALHQRRIEPGEERLVSCLPEWAKRAFTSYDKLNRVQSKICDTALHSTHNMLVLAPFVAGETINVALLTILPHIKKLRRNEKIVYLVPARALVADVVDSLSRSLESFGGVKVRELIGDISPQQIEETAIFVTIPEEWDVITRRSVFSSVTALVKLVIIDGIHLIHDQNRGHIIEAIIARTVRQNDTTNKNDRIRLVALSFPFAGYEELALFLRVDLTEGLFYFDNSYRNSCISHQYIGVWKPCNSRLYPFLNDLCYKKVIAAGGKQVIIFVCSRKDTVNTACAIRSFEMAKHTMSTILKGSSVPIGNVKSNVLKQLLPYGLAIHHLGLDSNDRKEVVDLFQKGHVKVLVCTQTLAWGVNLRADTVIIKGTLVLDRLNQQFTELSLVHVMQMLSHAEREGIIITGDKELRQYTYMMNEQFPIESHMVPKLADQLNTEIGLGSVRSAEEARNWFRYTYLYFCMIRNPSIYGVPADELKGDITLEKRCKEFIQAAVTILDANELVIYEGESGYLEIREWGRISCYYSVCLGTTFEYKKGLASTMGDMDLFKLFLRSEEFKPVGLELDEDNKLKEKLLSNLSLLATGSLEDEHTAKINVFLQKLEKLSDMVYIQQSAERHLRALLQIVLQRRQFKLAHKALNLCKMVKKLIHQLPKLTISAHFKPINDILLRVELTLKPDFKWDDNVHGYVEPFWVIVEHNDCIIHHEYFLLKQQYINKNHTLNFTVSVISPLQYHICVVSDRWIGSQADCQYNLEHLNIPDTCPPLTELLELPPSSADAFEHPLYMKLYEGRINHFNRIQTQVFKALYESDDNILVAAPTGNGKTLCAEFAILRNHRENGPGMSVVYIAPSEALAKERFRDWEIKFKHSGLNLEVFKLTGETATDLKLLEKGQIIISTPEKWDALSRSWKQRKGVYGLSLFIVDDLHLIGGQDGSILEVIVSRMRYIQCINAVNQMRIVALSTSVDDGEDIGRWIGAPKHALFNFLPHVRQMPVDIVLQEIDLPNVEIRITGINMAKLTCTTIFHHARNGKPCLVYVPTDQQVQPAALNLVTLLSADSNSKHSLSLLPYIGKVTNRILKHTLLHGVGYLNKGLTSGDQQVVSQLFEAEKIQICVMSSSMCCGVPLSAYLVVVMGTQYHDEQKKVLVDYSVSDLLQMVGHAGRPQKDDSAKCIILCHAPSASYYEHSLNSEEPDALSVESHLPLYLHDNLNAEVVAGTITNKEEALKFLGYTFFSKRAIKNPSYYFIDSAERSIFNLISRLVDKTLSDLQERKFIAVQNDTVLSPLSLGEIASDNCISYSTIEVFRSSLTSETNMKGLLQILTCAFEYSELPIRPEDEEVVRALIKLQRLSWENPKCSYPHIKAFALLQAHFERQPVDGNLAWDQREVLVLASRLLPVMVDVIAVISRNGCLLLALLAMQVNQMVTQGLWECDSELLQIPHFTKELAERCKHNPGKSIETVDSLLMMEEAERCELLMMSNEKILDIVRFCKRFPKFTIKVEVLNSEKLGGKKHITLEVHLKRHLEERTAVGPVDAPRYPYAKEEGWWLLLGDSEINSLLDIQRVSRQSSKVQLVFVASAKDGKKTYTLYHVCDSYLGCKQEFCFTV